MRKSIAALVAVVLAVAGLTGAATASSAKSSAMNDDNIVQTAVGAGQFKTLVSLVKKAGLAGTLQGKGPFTVFAPTDAAFAKVPKATLTALGKDKALLKKVLLYHVVKGNVTANKVVKLKSATTLNGQTAAIRVTGTKVFVGGARVTTADVKASNGVIHVINKVLLPPNIVQTAVAAGQFKTLVSLVKKAGLAGTLQGKGPFTVFAPTDAAFAKVPKATLTALGKDKALLKKVLLYHVVKGNVTANKVVKLKSAKSLQGDRLPIRVTGGKVFVDGARVVTPDVKASNGVIHVINKVLIPMAA